MSDFTLPLELFQKCQLMVEATHRKRGIGDLSARIATPQNMVALAIVPEGLTMLRSMTAALKLRIASWIAVVVLLAASWAFSGWLAPGAALAVIFDRRLATQRRRGWLFLAAVLLTLDVLIQDFAGWGTTCPAHRSRALRLPGSQTGSLGWFDFYFPDQPIPSELAHNFAPGAG
jgi:hypothetical protein